MADDSDETRSCKAVGYGSPPVEHRIRKGERRNPNGRRGKGNPAPKESEKLSLAAVIREEMTRVIKQQDGTEIEMHRRVVKAAAFKAANGDLSATRFMIAELRRLEEREERKEDELCQLALEYRFEGLEIFVDYHHRGLEPPNIIPHPAHVIVGDDGVRIAGPVDHDGQLAWERLKRCIVLLTDNLAQARRYVGEYPGEDWAEQSLANSKRLRRKAMRMVPSGWNWREKIRNCASVAEARARLRLIQQFTEELHDGEHDQA